MPCAGRDNPGTPTAASVNVLPAADLLPGSPPESTVVNHKMFPGDSSEDSLSACDWLQIYGTRRALSLTGKGRGGEAVSGLRWAAHSYKAVSDASYELGLLM